MKLTLLTGCTLGLFALILGLPGCSPQSSNSEANAGAPLRVAAASDLKFALDTLIEELYQDVEKSPIEVTYGSSGNLRAQIQQGAPYDLFLSADMKFPKMLVESGQGIPETLFQYAVGRIVIWVPDASPIDVESLRERSLLEPSVRRISIANPRHAPYGQAAVAALESYGLLAEVESRFVMGENIAQAAQFVESRAADIGIIALALAVAPAMKDKGRFWEIPLEQFPTMLQGGVITRQSRQPERAQRLAAAIISDQGRSVLQRYGFILPDEQSLHSHATN